MKKIALSILLVLSGIIASQAQSIGLGVAFPQNDTKFSEAVSKILVNRIHGILNSDDITDNSSDFVIVPKTSLLSEDLIEGGMKNFFKVEIELTLEVLQLSTNKVFGTTSIELKGSGARDKNAAFKAAISSLSKKNPTLSNFFQETKAKIIDYYEQNSASIIASATAAATQGNYEQAIAMLSAFPTGLKSTPAAQKRLNEIYDRFRTHNCQQIILEAKGAISTKDYATAVELLSSVDSDSSCKGEASNLLGTINQEIRAAEAQQRADQKRREEMAADMQKTRIKAAAEVAKAYYQRTYPNYYIIW